MARRGVTLERKCENCVNYKQREVGKREARKIRRSNRRTTGGHRFEFAAQPFQHSAAVVASGPAVSDNGSLQPGERREMEQIRAEMPIDIWTYALKGATIGAAGLGICIPLAVWVDTVPWYAPFVIAPAVGGLGILGAVFFPKEQVVGWLEGVLNRDLDGDGQAGTVHYVIEGKLEDERGNQHLLRFTLESDNGNVRWHNFCRAVLYERANFSETEAVKRQGLSPKDWQVILRTFAAQQWVRLAKQRGTPKLRGLGWQWVKHYADHPPAPDGEALSFGDVDR